MEVLMYRSPGTDEMTIACRTVEEAVNCFRADAGVILHDGEEYEIEVWQEEMTEEQLSKLQEV